MFSDVTNDPSKFDLESDKYLVRLVKLEASDHPQYGAGVRWIFNFAHRGEPPVPIIDPATGDKLEIWQSTKPDLTPGTKAGLWAAALLGRDIKVGESGAQIAESLIGKYALALWGVNPRSEKGNKGILAMEPYQPATSGNGKGKAPAKTEPAPDSLLTPEETAAGVGDF